MQEETLLIRLSKTGSRTKHENTLALHFENTYPQIAFSNLEDISRQTATSKSTVTRFIQRLGYRDFKSFSRALKDEVTQNFDLPLERSVKQKKEVPNEGASSILQKHLRLGILNLQRTLEHVDEETFLKIADLLSDEQRPLYLMAAATGRQLLNYFYLLTKYQRSGVHILSGTDRLAHDVIDATPSSVLLATNFDRHPRSVMAVLKHFHDLGAETILISNRRSTPLLRYAKHALFVHSESETIFKSRGAMLVMLEALVEALGERLKTHNTSRFLNMEKLFKEFGVYVSKDGL